VTDGPASGASVRLDKWLWFARFCKTRSLAQTMIARGQVEVDGQVIAKTAFLVKPGQRIVFTLGQTKRTVIVTAMGERRGPPPEARTLYEERSEPEHLPPGDGAVPLKKKLRFAHRAEKWAPVFAKRDAPTNN